MLDLEPETLRMASLLAGVSDEGLVASTPCDDYTLGDLIDHIAGLALAFTVAAHKEHGAANSQPPSGDASRLTRAWRTQVTARLATLAGAWRDEEAWQGMTRAGGIDLPAEVAGAVVLNELVLHGWDVARASGQEYIPDPRSVDGCLTLVSQQVASGGPTPYGPAFDVASDASPFDRLLGLSGRNPDWAAAEQTG